MLYFIIREKFMANTRKENNLKIMQSISPSFISAWDDIVNHNFIEFVSNTDFELLPSEQRLCCLHLASLGARLKKADVPELTEDLSEYEEYLCDVLGAIQKKDYKLANKFIDEHFTSTEDTANIVIPNKLGRDFKLTVLFMAGLRGWSVEKSQVYRIYQEKDEQKDSPFIFNKQNQLHAGFLLEMTALSIFDGQTIPHTDKYRFKSFTRSLKKIPYGMITKQPETNVNDWRFKLIRKDGQIIDVDKEKYLNRIKKDSAHLV